MGYGFLLFLVSVLCLTTDEIEAERSGWSATPNTQYHIQTDEGPERYFRFQTLNGQYRKEKRLEDGTVIGTEGWLDPLGYLRIKDYIADAEGFRILKSKMVFVGQGRPIEDAVAASKRVPAQSGILAKPRRPPNPFREPALQDVSNSIETKNNKPYAAYLPGSRRYQAPSAVSNSRSNYDPRTIDPRPILSSDDYTRPTKKYFQPSYMFQTPYERRYRSSYPHVAVPVVVMQPPILDENIARLSQPSQLSQPSPPSQPLATQVAPESSYGRYRTDRRETSTVGPIVSNNYNNTGRRQYRGSVRSASRNRDFTTREAVYASDRSDASRSRGSSRTDEYEFPPYDGHHTTADGFQYYLKTHYHEEEKKPDGEKSIGSFGYVDPFGIRRVVYYKSDPQNGFVHKKNNRYVGFEATPYDPLPPDTQ